MFSIYIPKCIPQQSLSFIHQMLLELHPYKVATSERLICIVIIRKTDYQQVVTFEYNGVKTWNLYHHVRYELRNGLWGKLFILLPFFITNKSSAWNSSLKLTCHNVWTKQPFVQSIEVEGTEITFKHTEHSK